MEYKEASLEFKAAAEPGSFTGYGAVFGNIDDGYDVIEAGAFKKMRKKSNGAIRMPLYHDMSKVVGEAFVVQDEKGLQVTGQLNMALSYAADAYELMKDGTLNAMSVGFSILKDGAKYDDDYSKRVIKSAELWEVSIVPFGMNRKAKIRTVKSADEIVSIRDYEAILKGVGFSGSQSKALAAHGYQGLNRDGLNLKSQREADSRNEKLKAIRDALRS